MPWFPDRSVRLETNALEPLIHAFDPHLLRVREPFGASTGLALRQRLRVPFIVSLHTFAPLYDRRLNCGPVVAASDSRPSVDALVAAQDQTPSGVRSGLRATDG